MFHFSPLPTAHLPGGASAALFPYVAPTYSQTPNDLFPGMTVSGTDLIIPIAALADHKVTAANAHQTTGDARKLLYGFIARGEEWYKDLSIKPEALTVAPRFTAAKLESSGTTKLRVEFKYQVHRDRPDGDVADEPTS